MKKMKRLLSLLAVAAVFALLGRQNILSVSAAEPVTFYARYDNAESDWYIQRGTWDPDSKGLPVYYLNNGDSKIQEGDLLVVMSNDGSPASKMLSVDVRLSNLTVAGASAIIKVNGIDECYVLGDSITAVNGEVTNAYVYNKTICSFIDNVGTLTINDTNHDYIEASISVGGTIDHVIEITKETVRREFYSVAAGKLYYDTDGKLQTKAEHYSLTPPATPAVKPSSATAPSGDSYIVKKGDTLSKIAKSNGMSLKQIVALNPQIKNINLIRVGQKINLK